MMKPILKTIYMLGLLLVMPTLVSAAPGIPHQFYGTATYTDGSNITNGNVIVKIGTSQVASVPINSGKYGYNPDLLLIIDPDNDRAGKTLEFFIGSVDTSKTAIFTTGGYTELDLTIAVPSDTVTGNDEDVSLNSTVSGEVNMPIGATNIVLTDATVMNLSSGLSGDAVTLNSGLSGNPIILANSNLSGISASVPDGTKIQGPSGWDGKIAPPVSETPSGTAPAGFSVGSTVISIGSSGGTLVFDKPVTILLPGVAGTVGYKPSGSNTWVQITNVCGGGSYSTPTAPTAPGECVINNGIDTKIVTYHFTSFGSLNVVVTPPTPAPVSSRGGGGSSTPNVPIDEAEIEEEIVPEVVSPESEEQPVVEAPKPQVLGEQIYADGTLIRGSDKKIYAVLDNALKHISSLKELQLSYAGKPIFDISDSVIARYGVVSGTKIYSTGKLIRASDKKIYAVLGNTLRHITSLEELRRSYAGIPILDVADSVIASYGVVAGAKVYGPGELIRGNDKKIYVITPKNQKRRVLSLEELARDYFQKSIHDVPDSVIAQY